MVEWIVFVLESIDMTIKGNKICVRTSQYEGNWDEKWERMRKITCIDLFIIFYDFLILYFSSYSFLMKIYFANGMGNWVFYFFVLDDSIDFEFLISFYNFENFKFKVSSFLLIRLNRQNELFPTRFMLSPSLNVECLLLKFFTLKIIKHSIK